MRKSLAARQLNIRLLQMAVFLGAGVPVSAGLIGIIMGSGVIASPDDFLLPIDSHFRYLSGLLLAVGLGFWLTIPHIEQQGIKFRLLTFIVFVGGLARLVSVYVHGWPSPPMIFGLCMELIVTPLLSYWQYRMAKL